MADNQQSNQKPQDQKPGLTWSQPSGAQRNAQSQAKQSTPPAGNESGGRVIGIIVGVVIILALVVWGITALRHRNETVSSTASSTTETANVESQGETVVTAVEPKPVEEAPTAATTPVITTSATTVNASFSAVAQPAGDSVAVTGLSLSQPTWVIVYESRGGKPGNILGAGLFFSGDAAASVPLMRATVAGQTYFVTEAIDNGDKLFSIKDEKPLTDASGAQVWTTFTAQ